MSHFISRPGEILHLHPLALHPVALGCRPFRDAFESLDASSHAPTTSASSMDDLAFLALRGEHEAPGPRGDLGQFGLLSGGEPGEGRLDSTWCSLG